MFKILLSVVSILVLLLPSILIPSRATACPVDPPETLLSLYKSSDAIYVATFDRSIDHEITEDDEERTVVNVKNHFDISSTLKGEPRKFLVLDHTEHRYKLAADSSDDESEEPEEPDAETLEVEEAEDDGIFGRVEPEPGDLLLMFIKNGEADDGPQLAHYRDAIKKMTPARVESYEARIRDLNSIFSAQNVDDAAIVDWLVRCALDPLTRWEGAFELLQSFEELEWREEQKREAENDESGDDVEEVAPEEESPSVKSEDEGDVVEVAGPDHSVYARLLSDTHKQALMNILLERTESPEPGRKDQISIGDRTLIDLVSKWGDDRFAHFLLDRIERSTDNASFVSDAMSKITKLLGDPELDAIESDFDDILYEDDDEFVAEVSRSIPERDVSVPVRDPEEWSSEEIETTPNESTEAPDAPKITYKQLRAELIAKFVVRARQTLQIADLQAEEERAP